jgi:glutamate dehydrogenase (NAD(P)+)
VVAVADEHGCVVDPAGLDLARMLHSPPGTPVPRMDVAGTRLPGDALFEMPADVLTLAAGADAVGAGHAAAPACPAVAVGANCGLSESAEATLYDRGVLVVPDFIGGIGGSASMEALFGPASPPTASEVLTSVAHLARRLVDDLFSTARRHGEPPRRAALRLADRAGVDPGAPPYGHSPYLTHSGV